MEAIIIFLSSFIASLSSFIISFIILSTFKDEMTNVSSLGKKRLSRALHDLTNKVKLPRGTVLHSPTPEEEEKEEWEKAKKYMEKRRQEITEDYRKV